MTKLTSDKTHAVSFVIKYSNYARFRTPWYFACAQVPAHFVILYNSDIMREDG